MVQQITNLRVNPSEEVIRVDTLCGQCGAHPAHQRLQPAQNAGGEYYAGPLREHGD